MHAACPRGRSVFRRLQTRFHSPAQKRDNSLSGLPEERIEHRCREALLVIVKEHVVGRLPLLCAQRRKAARRGDYLVQDGRERGEIVFLLGLFPHRGAAGKQLLIGAVFLLRNFLQRVELAAQTAQNRPLAAVQRSFVNGGRQLAHARAGHQREIFLRQRADNARREGCSLGRGLRFRVPAEQRQCGLNDAARSRISCSSFHAQSMKLVSLSFGRGFARKFLSSPAFCPVCGITRRRM